MKNIKKTFLMLMIICAFAAPITALAATPDNELITDGAYVQMGTYNGEPILWRCVSTSEDDENGKLILSDRILCYKCFDYKRSYNEDLDKYYYSGSPYWEDSNIRAWLNSTQAGGSVVWPGNNPPAEVENAYSDEDGFLSSTNFSDTEISAMKSVSQWQILTYGKRDEVTNGYEYFFQQDGKSARVSPHSGATPYVRYPSISALSHVEGGMKKIVDTVFFLDEPQVYNLYMKYDALSTPTDKALEGWNVEHTNPIRSANTYWLRTTPNDATVNVVFDSNGYGAYSPYYGDLVGIRPAFYLNEDNVRVLSGNGEWYDPYIIDGYGENGTTVFSMSREVNLSTDPIINGETILVPIQEIYESLGASVYFDEENRILTATDGKTNVIMEIGNPLMGNGIDVITLDPAPEIIDGVVMVTLDAVNNSFNAAAEYIGELDRLVIDIPQEQVFSDEVGLEQWQKSRVAAAAKKKSE